MSRIAWMNFVSYYKQFRTVKRKNFMLWEDKLENLCIIFPISNLYTSFIAKICSLKNKGLVCDLTLLKVIVLSAFFCNLFIGINVEAEALTHLLKQ